MEKGSASQPLKQSPGLELRAGLQLWTLFYPCHCFYFSLSFLFACLLSEWNDSACYLILSLIFNQYTSKTEKTILEVPK